MFLTLIAGYLYTSYKEARNRRWDIEDRAALSATVKQRATKIADDLTIQNDKLDSKLDEHAGKLDVIAEQTNGELAKLKLEVLELHKQIENFENHGKAKLIK